MPARFINLPTPQAWRAGRSGGGENAFTFGPGPLLALGRVCGVSVFMSLRDTRKAKKIVGPPSRRPGPARRRRYEIFEAGHG
jgi:hypothetical protein